jgi:Zn-dependent peptidase ImmA (M78 family)
MKLRRGFRKEAEEYAEEFRTELDLDVSGPLCPFKLAQHLEIPVVSLSNLEGLNSVHLDYVQNDSQNTFSATTVAEDSFKLIVHNDFHHPFRQNSNLMHELAHILLGHPPRPPLAHDKCRNFDAQSEYEANQLGFTLLIPKVAALRIIESGMGPAAARQLYGVSSAVLQHRLSITDVKRWADHRRRLRRAAE